MVPVAADHRLTPRGDRSCATGTLPDHRAESAGAGGHRRPHVPPNTGTAPD